MKPTEAWLRVKKQIDEHSREREGVERFPAMRAEAERLLENPRGKMAKRRTAKQKAATRKMIAASRRKRRGGRRRRRAAPRRRRASRRRRMRANPVMRKNPVAKTAAGRRRQRAASRRNIKKAIRARRRSRRVTSRVRAIRKAAGRGGVRLVRVRQASTPIVIEERPRRRKRRAALLENPRRRKRSRKTRRRRRYASASAMMQQNAGMSFRRRRGLLQNPLEEAMQENQTFTIGAIQAAGIAGLGVGLGLAIADGADRFVATRKPKDGKNPYYGANAAAAQNRRPDAWRLGAQAAGGVAGVALAYAVRGRMILPFLVGGTAVGFFANLTKMLLNWYAMPMVFKVASGSEASFANRMYPLEQKSVQDVVDQLFTNWQTAVNLNLNQQDPPQIVGVMPVPTTGPAYTLGRKPNGANGAPQGKARAQSAEASGRVGQPTLVLTGRLGMCDSCGGSGGCWDHCPELVTCGDCTDELIARRCEYVVQAGDDLSAMAAQYGIDVAQVDALNAPGYWVPGNKVVLPFAFCRVLEGPTASFPTRPVGCPPGTYMDPVTGQCLSLIRGVPGLAGAPRAPEAVMPFGLAAAPEE